MKQPDLYNFADSLVERAERSFDSDHIDAVVEALQPAYTGNDAEETREALYEAIKLLDNSDAARLYRRADELTPIITPTTHTAIDDGQTLWIVALPKAQVLAELRDLADDESDDADAIAYGEWCQAHDTVAEYAEARSIIDKHDLPRISYLPGTGWQ